MVVFLDAKGNHRFALLVAVRATFVMTIFMVYNRIMRINVHEAKAGLSGYLKRAQGGERIIICNRNVPVAELKPIGLDEAGTEPPSKSKRILGFAAGRFVIPESFYEPMTDEEIAAWEGPILPSEEGLG